MKFEEVRPTWEQFNAVATRAEIESRCRATLERDLKKSAELIESLAEERDRYKALYHKATAKKSTWYERLSARLFD